MQLNMLQSSKLVPTILARAHLCGQHDYNSHPLAHIYCVVEMHVQLKVRKTHGGHSLAGYHVGTLMVHYIGQQIYVTKTNDIRGRDTIFYKHKYLTMSIRTKVDTIEDAAKDLKKAIEGGIPQPHKDRETLNKSMGIIK